MQGPSSLQGVIKAGMHPVKIVLAIVPNPSTVYGPLMWEKHYHRQPDLSTNKIQGTTAHLWLPG